MAAHHPVPAIRVATRRERGGVKPRKTAAVVNPTDTQAAAVEVF